MAGGGCPSLDGVPYHSQDQTIRSGWPVRFRPTSFPIPFSDDISALTPHLPDFSMAPSDTVFLQDASWFPTGRHSGGVVAVLDVHTGHYTLHRIPIPIFCDNLYQAELYVAWIVLRARACARWYTRDERWSLTDSNSYVTALGSRNDSSSPLVTSLLAACRALVQHAASPRHLYSHLTGTFLDRVMDVVDCLAREVGLSQIPRCGWIPELQQLLVLFTHNNRQVQDFQAFLVKKIPACVLSTRVFRIVPPLPTCCGMNELLCLVPLSGMFTCGQLPSDKACTHPPRLPLAVWSHNHPAPLDSRVPAFGLLLNCCTHSTGFGHFRLCATPFC